MYNIIQTGVGADHKLTGIMHYNKTEHIDRVTLSILQFQLLLTG